MPNGELRPTSDSDRLDRIIGLLGALVELAARAERERQLSYSRTRADTVEQILDELGV